MEHQLLRELALKTNHKESYIQNVIQLLDAGNTVPFIARYRKEMTGAMNEEDIKNISDVHAYLISLNKRKEEVIRLIDNQGLLTDELKKEIERQTVLNRVEDLYRPFKQKKKTRATEAKRKGLEPLSKKILNQNESIEDIVKHFLNDEVKTTEEAIKGAEDIIAEVISDNPKYRQHILKVVNESGIIKSTKKKKAKDDAGIFEIYYNYSEPVKKIVPHRMLALNRGEDLDILSLQIVVDENRLNIYILNQILKPASKTREYLTRSVQDALKRLILPSIEREVRAKLTERAEMHAVNIFEENLKQLLLQPPLKGRTILGVDPAYRMGCKLAVINENGEFLSKNVIFPHKPVNKVKESNDIIVSMIEKYSVNLIAIGNGTASRETEQFIAHCIQKNRLNVQFLIVNEAGASVYSASEVAREEFPDFQVEERSAVSIARRVQDPLSELVKIDPKSIGVGQYQHDVNQKYLSEALKFVVETSVNRVGVNINTASATLLNYVSGLTPSICKNIVEYRLNNNGFKSRKEVQNVSRLGEKTYEQCIGFLRIPQSKEPLDVTPIHPDHYDVTYQLIDEVGLNQSNIGSQNMVEVLNSVNIKEMSERLGVGLPTLKDIIESLKAPQRDIRDDYETPILKSDVLSMEDLTPGMTLKGTVRNIIDFGVFVDIGVKQDGLVHISQMTEKYIKHPLEVTRVGEIIDVKVLEVDINKERISLTMKNV